MGFSLFSSPANPGPLGMITTYQLARVGITLLRVRVANDIFSCLYGINSSSSSILEDSLTNNPINKDNLKSEKDEYNNKIEDDLKI